MQITRSNRDVFLYNITTPKYNNRLIAQVSLEKRDPGDYLSRAHTIHKDWDQGLDSFAQQLCNRVIRLWRANNIVAPTHHDFACTLTGAPHSETRFSPDDLNRTALIGYLGQIVRLSIDSHKTKQPLPPDRVIVKTIRDGENICELMIDKVLTLSTKDQTVAGDHNPFVIERPLADSLETFILSEVLQHGLCSTTFFAQHGHSGQWLSLEVFDLQKNSDQFYRKKNIVAHLPNSHHIGRIYGDFILPDSQLGVLIGDPASLYGTNFDILRQGADDQRIRVIAKQLFEILDEFDRHHIYHQRPGLEDFRYFQKEGRIKLDALEHAIVLDNQTTPDNSEPSYNPTKTVVSLLSMIICHYPKPREKPDWLSQEMFDFLGDTLQSGVSAQKALQAKVFQDIGDRPRLLLPLPAQQPYEPHSPKALYDIWA